MSAFTVKITTHLRQNGLGGFVSPVVVGDPLTQITQAKVRIPKRGSREAELTINLHSTDLATVYDNAEDNKLRPYKHFLYMEWRGHPVFWGPIVTKEIDFEERSLTLRARDQSIRLEHHFYRLGDEALNHPTDPTKGFLLVGTEGLRVSVEAGELPSAFAGFALGIEMGTDTFGPGVNEIIIERSQEVWRTMVELTERTDGPLFELVPADVDTSPTRLATLNSFGQIRDNHTNPLTADYVSLDYNTGNHNLRNIRPTEGGKLLTFATVVSEDLDFRVNVIANDQMNEFGQYVHWEAVDFNVANIGEADELLGAVGAAYLNAYAQPLTNLDLELRRDDEVGATNQFYYIEDFKVADLIHISGTEADETVSGNYQIEEVSLEQEPDGTGEVRQVVQVVPYVDNSGDYVTEPGEVNV